MATYDITLPAKIRAQFPDRCVACELEHPTSTGEITVTGEGEGPSAGELLLDAATNTTSRHGTNVAVTVKFPSCLKCAGPLRRRHFWMTFWLYAGALGGVAVGCILLMLTKSVWLLLIPILAGVIIPVIYNLRNPPAFTFTPMGERMIYEFRSERYAKEFAEKNGVAYPAGTAIAAESGSA